jgi:hypothetical protein
MTPIALRYQQASTNIAEAADLRRLGAETSAARGLLQQQGDIGYRDNKLAAQTQRYGYDQQVKAVGLQTGAQRYESSQATARTGMETQAQRYGYDSRVSTSALLKPGGTGMETQAQRCRPTDCLQTDAF